MTVLQALVLGIIQGITEFLPVSSSGHLIIVPKIFGWGLQDLSFDVALHLGTTFAVLAFFWKDWVKMVDSLKKDVVGSISRKPVNLRTLRPQSKLFLVIIAVSIPVGIAGLLLEGIVNTFFRMPLVVSIMLISIALVMWAADRCAPSTAVSKERAKTFEIRFANAMLISLSQVVALIPGTSRSGVTISAGLFLGLSREQAARFSFLLSTPLIIGASVVQLLNLSATPGVAKGFVAPFLTGFFVSFVIGLFSIRVLLQFLLKNSLTIFVAYRVILGLAVITLL